MEKFSRSKSTRENPGLQLQQPSSMRDLRSYSTSAYKPTENRDYKTDNFKDVKLNNKGSNNKNKISASSSTKNWNFNVDPELQRKKRVAGYKAYTVEGKMKSTFSKSFRWMKDVVVHGFWSWEKKHCIMEY